MWRENDPAECKPGDIWISGDGSCTLLILNAFGRDSSPDCMVLHHGILPEMYPPGARGRWHLHLMDSWRKL